MIQNIIYGLPDIILTLYANSSDKKNIFSCLSNNFRIVTPKKEKKKLEQELLLFSFGVFEL